MSTAKLKNNHRRLGVPEYLVCSVRACHAVTLIAIYRAMNRDPAYFDDPDVFRPERYLDTSGQLNDTIPGTHNHGHMSFSTGRRCEKLPCAPEVRVSTSGSYRVCPGKDLAVQTLSINITMMLWTLSIEPIEDDSGTPVLPSNMAFVDNIIMM